ncbi:conjugal transfer protein TraF [Vibrio halioticoli NBRC 102217]|uniref:Signal peptidase I n=1 Tax=Vibrio halioticoli NBRC 102217 TaxID=1219072 RepID=V5FM66_9VIBR|nr:signal peptidase I [Vibrio halioticoli]GAD89947.1 conjugal transfer protein TraF [Vibrio halioticoli NBRC 102217]
MEATTQRQHPLWILTKMIWLGIFMVIGASILFHLVGQRYQVVFDTQAERCIPEYSVYLVDRSVTTFERGGIYTFTARNMTPYFEDGQPIGKYLAGVAGDHVVQNKHGVFINGTQIADGNYAAAEKLGVSPEHYHKTFVIPEGHFFFVGSRTAPRSFDSRYYGLVNQDQLVGGANPLW